MRFIGGKNRIAKFISNVITRDYPSTIIEPFCGALNVSTQLLRDNDFLRVVCSDAHDDLIDMWIAIQNGWRPPVSISPEQYQELMKADSSPLRTFVGYGCSFSGKWFGGFAQDNTGRNYCSNAKNSIDKIIPEIERIEFNKGGYDAQHIPADAVVYCDPPYAGTTKPGERSDFDHDKFWKWVSSLNVDCYVSEYTAPDTFQEVWRKEVKADMRAKPGNEHRIEKLFFHPRLR